MKVITRRLERGPDLVAFGGGDGCLFVRDGVGLAGRGVAMRVRRGEAQETLAAMDVDDDVQRPGTGPVAFGALGFDPAADGDLVVPATIVGRGADGTSWVTRVGDADEDLVPYPAPETRGGAFSLRPGFAPDVFQAAVCTGRDAVRAGRLTKVVLARDVFVEAENAIDVHAVLNRLRASFGSSHLYVVDGFIGASPELLVARHGDVVRSHPLAGTTPRTGDPVVDARLAAQLIASTKDQTEHRVTIEMVHDTLLPWCSYVDWEAEPSIVTVANVQHLGTAVEGRLSKPEPSVLELVAALHPTPALGGFPRADALALIAELEPFDRGPYGGPVGWVDGRGDGEWAVGIRGAQIDGRTARLLAGVGVVAGSDPDAELAETQAKFQAMLSAIVRP
jgi:menaquinone-specific isochorismate synthase